MLRHLAAGKGPIHDLDQLRAPMGDIMTVLTAQIQELARYKALYGELQRPERPDRPDRKISRGRRIRPAE